MLVLAHADRLGVDLHQLGEWILKAPRNGDRAAQGDVESWQLIARQLAGRIHRRARLVHHDDLWRIGERSRLQCLSDTRFRLARGRPIADRDKLRAGRGHESHERCRETIGLVQHPHVGVEHRARARDGRDLHAGPESRVETDDDALARRSRKQQLLEVAAEDGDRLLVGARLQLEPQLDLDGECQQPLVGVARHELELGERAAPRRDAREEARVNLVHWRGNRPRQDAFLFAAANREHTVRRNTAERLGEIVVVLELGDLGFLSHDRACGHAALAAREVAHPAAQLGILGNALAQDVPRAGECVVRRWHLALRADKLHGPRHGSLVVDRVVPDQVREWLEPPLARDDRPGAALRLEGKVKVLERLLRRHGVELRAELRRQLALLVDGLPDCGSPFAELPQVFGPLLDGAQLCLVEPAGGFLAIPCDKGKGVALGEQLEGAGHLADGERELLRQRDGDLCEL